MEGPTSVDTDQNPNSRRQRIIEFSAFERHDADIPSNAGRIPIPEEASNSTTSTPRSTTSELDKDIEKHAISRRASTVSVSSRIVSMPEKEHGGENVAAEEEDEESDDPDAVSWDGLDDKANPMNWSKGRRWGAMAVVSGFTFLTPLGSSIFAPGVQLVMDEFRSTNSLLQGFIVSVYVLGFAFGPLVIAPLSEMYGRLPLYHSCNILFFVFNIACAVSGNISQLIVFRFLAGSTGSAPLALGGGTIADLFPRDQRATAMAIWVLGPTLGPVIGPIAGGFISESLGWRWNFWIVAMTSGVFSILGIFLLKETYAPTLLKQKASRLRKSTGNPLLHSKLDTGLSTRDLFILSIVRPSKMLTLSPIVFLMSLYVALVYAYLYILFTTVSFVFERQYHFQKNLVGLSFVGLGMGQFLGQFGYTWYANRSYKKHVERGDFRPEHRLESMIPGAFLVPVGLFWYGWSVQADVHWICPMFAMGVFGAGLLVIFMPANTYLVDVFTVHAASAMAANTVLRSVFAAFLPMGGPKLYAALGYGWGNTLLGFISCLMIPIPFLFLRYGEWLRTNPRFQLKL
ncbi:MFS general substrate transporter [Tothia fuscella]|uniref:MFS general substrate transporter n=1 Tax=Tothia fuscella TaxID=1048955 RepID=A0A9P4TWX8_9PEZI|nr:MFS general substrate transporter [Tothia fuscella]